MSSGFCDLNFSCSSTCNRRQNQILTFDIEELLSEPIFKLFNDRAHGKFKLIRITDFDSVSFFKLEVLLDFFFQYIFSGFLHFSP